MYSLIVDSSTKILYIALLKDNNLLEDIYVVGQNDHAKNIVSMIDELLKRYNIESKDLNEVVCGYGPGSYTGVRMAVTVSKMLAVFMNIPLYTISTLRLMASGEKGKVLSLIDARRGNSFGMLFDMDKNEYVVSEGLYNTEELKNNKYDDIVTESDFKVDPVYCLNNKTRVENPDLLIPNYLRETEAERNLND